MVGGGGCGAGWSWLSIRAVRTVLYYLSCLRNWQRTMKNNIQESAPAMMAKVTLAKAVAAATGRVGHGGTTLPGRVARTFDRDLVGRLSRRLPQGAVVVSATNGKTTTCAMIAGIMQGADMKVVRNREGANLTAGIASALLKDSSLKGHPRSEIGLFEVDEAVFPEVATQGRPRIVLLMNLFRDQLDRYGELEHIAELWRKAVGELSDRTTTVLNADDPLVAELAALRPGKTLCYGVADTSAGGMVMQHASDSKYCSCGSPFEYEVAFIGHMGIYSCPSCKKSRPSPTVFAEKILLDGMRGSSFTLVTPDDSIDITLTLPGLYNIYNALAAAACCYRLDIPLKQIQAGLEVFSAVFGRVERFSIQGKPVCLLLVKNPAGFNEVVRTLMIEPGQKSLLVALNDKIADGRDISWIWDVDLEMLAGSVVSAVCSGTRAEEMAMRLKYAGLGEESLSTNPDLRKALREALDRTPEGETLFVLPTYTAMLALRQLINEHFETDRELGDLVWK